MKTTVVRTQPKSSPSECLQKSRNSHLIGRGIDPRDGLSQQVGTNEAAPSRVDKQNTTHHDTQNSLEHDTGRDPSQNENRLAERETGEKQAITTPLDGDLITQIPRAERETPALSFRGGSRGEVVPINIP